MAVVGLSAQDPFIYSNRTVVMYSCDNIACCFSVVNILCLGQHKFCGEAAIVACISTCLLWKTERGISDTEFSEALKHTP